MKTDLFYFVVGLFSTTKIRIKTKMINMLINKFGVAMIHKACNVRTERGPKIVNTCTTI